MKGYINHQNKKVESDIINLNFKEIMREYLNNKKRSYYKLKKMLIDKENIIQI